jgi:hypothetical protein
VGLGGGRRTTIRSRKKQIKSGCEICWVDWSLPLRQVHPQKLRQHQVQKSLVPQKVPADREFSN